MFNQDAKSVIDKLQYIIDRFVKVRFYSSPKRIINEKHTVESQTDGKYLAFFSEILSDKTIHQIRVFKEGTIEKPIPDFYEYTLVNRSPLLPTECFVDKKNNLMFFHNSQKDCDISTTYYSIGIGMLSTSLIYTHMDSNERVTETLLDLTRKCQKELDRVSTINDAEQLSIELRSYIETLMKLIELYPNPQEIIDNLGELIGMADELKIDLNLSIAEAKRLMDELKEGSNKAILISPVDWVLVSQGSYKYEYSHGLATNNLIVETSQLVNGVITSSTCDYEIPSPNKIVFYTSDNKITLRAIVNASYYMGTGGGSSEGTVVVNADNIIDGLDKVVMTLEERKELIEVGDKTEILNQGLEDTNIRVNNVSNINVKHFGAKGDGVTDDSEAIKRAISDFVSKEGSKFVVPMGYYNVGTENLTFDFGGKRNFHIECEGVFIGNSSTHFIELLRGVNVTGHIRVKNGGLYKTYDGFSHSTNGLTSAIYVRAISGLHVDITIDEYKGRGLEVEAMREGDNVKTDLFILGKLLMRRVGQSVYCNSGSGMGCFGDIWALEVDGAYFQGHDVSINSYENAMGSTQNGVLFQDCSSLHLGRILIGESGKMVRFERCYRATLDLLYLFGTNKVTTGVEIKNCYQFDAFIKSVNCPVAVDVDGLMESNIDINSRGDGTVLKLLSSTNAIQNLTVSVKDKDTVTAGVEVLKGSKAISNLSIAGNAKSVKVDSKDSFVDLNNLNTPTLDIPVINNVKCHNVKAITYTNEPIFYDNSNYPVPNNFPRNLIKNGGFTKTTAFADWSKQSTPTLTVGDLPLDGVGSKIVSTGTMGIKQDITCVTGRYYTLTFASKVESGRLLYGVNGGANVYKEVSDVEYNTLTFKATATTHTILFYALTGTSLIDGVCVTKGVKPVGFIPFTQEV